MKKGCLESVESGWTEEPFRVALEYFESCIEGTIYSGLKESEEATFFLHLLSHVATPLFPAFRARFRNSPQTLPKVYRRSHFLQRGVVFGFLTII